MTLRLLMRSPRLLLRAFRRLAVVIRRESRFLMITTFVGPTRHLMYNGMLRLQYIITSRYRSRQGIVLVTVNNRHHDFRSTHVLLIIRTNHVTHRRNVRLNTHRRLILQPNNGRTLHPRKYLRRIRPNQHLLIRRRLSHDYPLRGVGRNRTVLTKAYRMNTVREITRGITILIFTVSPHTNIISVLPITTYRADAPCYVLLIVPNVLVLSRRVQSLSDQSKGTSVARRFLSLKFNRTQNVMGHRCRNTRTESRLPYVPNERQNSMNTSLQKQMMLLFRRTRVVHHRTGILRSHLFVTLRLHVFERLILIRGRLLLSISSSPISFITFIPPLQLTSLFLQQIVLKFIYLSLKFTLLAFRSISLVPRALSFHARLLFLLFRHFRRIRRHHGCLPNTFRILGHFKVRSARRSSLSIYSLTIPVLTVLTSASGVNVYTTLTFK